MFVLTKQLILTFNAARSIPHADLRGIKLQDYKKKKVVCELLMNLMPVLCHLAIKIKPLILA